MATSYSSLEYTFYNNGASGASQIVGNSGDGVSKPRVVRYKFTAPLQGANALSFSKTRIGAYSGSSSTNEYLRFYVSSDPEAYAKADASFAYQGTVTMTYSGGYYTATGSVSGLLLLPGKTYYLFIFPGHTSFGLWNWNYPGEISVTLSGAAGIVYIDSGTALESYHCYIDNGSGWDLYIPYIDTGSSWDMYS